MEQGQWRNNSLQLHRWRCPVPACCAAKSIRADSWFQGSHLSLETILEITYLWTQDLPQKTIIKWCDISSRTAVDWCHFCREVCAAYLDGRFAPIGGPGKIVEIDESKFGKRKYNRGILRDGKWVFGGMERGSDNVFMEVVAAHDTATLLPIIQRNVLPGTDVYSDEWASYRCLATNGFPHGTVNHSVDFVDPVTGVHTQNIENTWKHAKSGVTVRVRNCLIVIY